MANLEIEIGAVTSGLDAGLSAAEKKLQAFGKSATQLGKSLSKNVTAPLAAIGAAAFAASARVGNFADELLDLEQQTGLSTDALQEYRAVTTRAGIATDAVARASENLQRRLASGEEGSKDLTDGLAALGISARDATGNLRGIDEVLEESITALAGFENITERNQLALKIFGRSASELAPLLSLGADGIEDAKNRAQELGLVLSRDALNAANDFRIKFDELRGTFSGVTNEIGLAFLPIATKLVDVFQNNIVPAIRSVIGFFNGLSTTTKTVIAVIAALVAAIGPLLLAVGGVISALPILATGIGAVKVALIALTGPVGIAVGLFIALGLGIRSLVKDVKLSEQTIKLQSTALDGFANANKLALEAQDLVNKSLTENGKVSKEASLQTRELIKSKIEDVRASLLQAKAANDVAVAEARKITFLDKLETVFLPGLASQQRRVNEVQKQGAKEIESINKLLNELTISLLKPIEPLIVLSDEVETTVEQFSKLADIANEKVFAQFAEDAALFNKELEQNLDLQKRIAASVGNIDTGPKVKNIGIGSIGGLPVVEIPQIDESKKTAFLASLKQFNDQASQILSSGISNAIGDFAFGLGEALGAGANVMDTIGAALLKGIAMIANQLGQAAIAIGVGMIAIKKSFSNPFTAIAAGAALVALAGVISSQVPKITAGGGGGTSGVGQSFEGSGVNTAFVDSFGALDIQGTSTIKGQDIIIAFDKANRTNGR